MLELTIAAKAKALGFDAVGFARADVALTDDFERYREFVDRGMHGDMAWLADNGEVRRRLDTSGVLEGAKSVICVARNYQRSERDEQADPATAQLVARYARGRDYHGHLKKKLRKLAAFVRRLGTADAPVHARPIADDAPVLERAWAARAGLGFVGKNGLLIVPGLGSMVLLGEVVTTLPLTPSVPMSERCGTCTRCLDACPTSAFVRPFVLDARRCIAYLTIEQRSDIDPSLRSSLGEHLFGCDDCQTVCPFNASAQKSGKGEVAGGFQPLPGFEGLDLTSLLELSGECEQEPAKSIWDGLLGSPLKRATADGLARNAAHVLATRPEARPALERAAATHPSPMVREAARWALDHLAAAAGPVHQMVRPHSVRE
jgi:epoxyqueuosine reductase